MATIRIYKVAEVLGIPSQEVIDLLKREHGIEAKSASSTIEEIVARQFAERTARERNLSLPAGPLFSAKSRSASRGRKGAKTPEAAARPRLGSPRLVKAPKVAPPVVLEEPPEKTEAPTAAETPPSEPAPAEPVEAAPPVPAASAQSPVPAAAAPPSAPVAATPVTPTGRLVPSMLKLRIEDKAPSLLPPAPAATHLGARPLAPTRPRPGSRPIGPAPTRPSTPPGGSRPLPAQPFRPPSGRPAVGYRPSFRPPPRRLGARKRRPARPMLPQTQAPPPPVTRTISLA